MPDAGANAPGGLVEGPNVAREPRLCRDGGSGCGACSA